MSYQRIFCIVLLLVALALGVVAWGYHAPFSYEPVGPRAYPLLLLAVLMAGSLLLILKPNMEVPEERSEGGMTRPLMLRTGICLLLFILLAFFYESLGFIPTCAVFALAMGRLFGGNWLPSAIQAVILSVGLFFLFDRVLDVPLPLGLFSGLEI